MSEPTIGERPISFSCKRGERGYEVKLDGQDLSSRIGGLEVAMRAHELPLVTLYTTTTVDDLELDARVQIIEPEVDGTDVARFLTAIDPERLEQAALNREDVNSEGGLTGAMLRQLIEWSQGKS